MIVFIDTNIIISAILCPNGKSALAFAKALSSNFKPIISDYIIKEIYDIFNEKFLSHRQDLEIFLSAASENIDIIKTPRIKNTNNNKLRDTKDMPILQAAISAKADYLLTGDKDFLESNIKKPICISPTDFLLI